MLRSKALISLVLVLVLAGIGAILLVPAPTLDPKDLDKALPTVQDLPEYVAHDGLTGSISVPTGNDKGRAVLSGKDLEAQCAKWRTEGDEWVCERARGVGMVVLEKSENVFFRLLSTVFAYENEEAAQKAFDSLTAAQRKEIEDKQEGKPGLGDASVSFKTKGFTAMAIRTGTVVVEIIVWDGSDQVSDAEEGEMAKKWPELQLGKIDELVG